MYFIGFAYAARKNVLSFALESKEQYFARTLPVVNVLNSETSNPFQTGINQMYFIYGLEGPFKNISFMRLLRKGVRNILAFVSSTGLSHMCNG